MVVSVYRYAHATVFNLHPEEQGMTPLGIEPRGPALQAGVEKVSRALTFVLLQSRQLGFSDYNTMIQVQHQPVMPETWFDFSGVIPLLLLDGVEVKDCTIPISIMRVEKGNPVSNSLQQKNYYPKYSISTPMCRTVVFTSDRVQCIR